MTDKQKLPKAEKKKGFDFSKLTETQWAMLAGAVFFIGYVIYELVLMAPAGPVTDGLNAVIQAPTTETAEQKFKRENKNIKLPDGSALKKEYVESKTKLTQEVPFGDKELEFVIRLPSNWVMSEFARYGLPGQENYAVLTNIARYFGPVIEDTRPFVWVEAERMTKYMTAQTWARAYMTKRGIAPEAFIEKSKNEVEALYVDVRDLRSYAVRTLFKIEGDTMVLVSFWTPVHSYKEYKDVMGLTLGSFHLINPVDRQIEKINSFRLLNVMNFDYYDSWTPKHVFVESTLRPSVELHNIQDVMRDSYNKTEVLQGLIFVNTWRKSPQHTDEKNRSEIMDRLQEFSMTLKDPIEPAKDLPLRDNFTSIIQTSYLAQVNSYVQRDKFDIVKSEESKTTQEIWITQLDNGYYSAYLTLITPPKAMNYVLWAQNMAAYELLLETINLRGAPDVDD